MMFIVDSNGCERIEDLCEELINMSNEDETHNAVVVPNCLQLQPKFELMPLCM